MATDGLAPKGRHVAAWRKANDFYETCLEVLNVALRPPCSGCSCGKCRGSKYDRSDLEALYEVACARGLLATLEKAWAEVEKNIEQGINMRY